MPDCAKIASIPMAAMTEAQCNQMVNSQRVYQSAAADPTAQRDGDEQMTCEQISAELHQQTYTKPDAAHLAEFKASTQQEQAINAKQQAEGNAVIARQTAEVHAASAVDTATEVATMGLVRGRAGQAVEAKQAAENEAMRKRMAAERHPTDERMTASMTTMVGDVTQQLSANPRLARLMQLANDKHCKGIH
jgi:hypothetical protein